jgi:hypothetical protein
MCWDNDGESWPFNSGTRTAHKTHRCAEGCLIQPGDTYHYWVGTCEGDFMTAKWCELCDQTMRRLGDACRLYDPHSSDPPIGVLRWELAEHVDSDLQDNGVPEHVIEALRVDLDALRARQRALT